MSDQFHALDGMTNQEALSANVKEFTGDGSAFLRVPGLKEVLGVRIGPLVIPLEHTQEFPSDATLKRFETRTEPLIKLVTSPDGEKILLRSKQSNDGIWQKDVKVYVAGDWAKEGEKLDPPKTEAPKEAEKPKEQGGVLDEIKKVPLDARKQAIEKKIPDADKLDQKGLVNALLKDAGYKFDFDGKPVTE